MKTLDQVRTELADTIASRSDILKMPYETIKDKNKRDRAYTKGKKQVAFLTAIRTYLEHSPSEQFVKSELERCEASLKRIDEGFETWRQNTPFVEVKTEKARVEEYKQEMGRAKIVAQIKTLKYLLA